MLLFSQEKSSTPKSQDSSPSSNTNQSEVSAITVQLQEVQPFQQNSGTHEDGDSNYQKRLQETLKRAVDLLHRLQRREEK